MHSELCELTLDARLFGHILVQKKIQQISVTFIHYKTSFITWYKLLLKYTHTPFNAVMNLISIEINGQNNFTQQELLKFFMPH